MSISQIETIKIFICGESEIGKQLLMKSYFSDDGNYDENVKRELIIKFKTIEIGSQKLKVQIMCKSQLIERHGQSIIPFLKNSDACIIVYDLIDNNSLNNIPMWIKEIKQCQIISNDNQIFIVGNKRDSTQTESNNHSTIQQYCDKFKYPHFIISESKFSNNLNPSLDYITYSILEKRNYQFQPIITNNKLNKYCNIM